MCGDGVAGRRRILSVPRLGSSAPLSRARACVPSLSLSLPRPSRRLSLPAPYRSGITNRPDDVRPETTAAYDARQFRSIAASALSAGSIGSFARARFPLPFPPAGHAGAPEPGRAGPAERILSRNRKKYSANTAGERGGGRRSEIRLTSRLSRVSRIRFSVRIHGRSVRARARRLQDRAKGVRTRC